MEQSGWFRFGALLAAGGMCITLASCSRAQDVFEGQEPNPAVRRTVDLAVAAGNAATDQIVREGAFDTPGWAITPDGELIIGAKSTPTRIYEFKESLTAGALTDGRVTEAEILEVQCTYGTGTINENEQFDGKFAISQLQMQQGKWTETMTRNELGPSPPPSICETVANELPNPQG